VQALQGARSALPDADQRLGLVAQQQDLAAGLARCPAQPRQQHQRIFLRQRRRRQVERQELLAALAHGIGQVLAQLLKAFAALHVPEHRQQVAAGLREQFELAQQRRLAAMPRPDHPVGRAGAMQQVVEQRLPAVELRTGHIRAGYVGIAHRLLASDYKSAR
jgi:hypothetical protein